MKRFRQKVEIGAMHRAHRKAQEIKLFFPGTRGEIDARTSLHRMHSWLLVEAPVLIDCGADWLDKLEQLIPR
jgi:hypothetical protein